MQLQRQKQKRRKSESTGLTHTNTHKHTSGSKHLLDSVARHVVEEERQQCRQQQRHQDFQNHPLKAMPQDVADGFQGVQEPNEGGIWTTART